MNSTRKRMRLLVVFMLIMSALALQTTKAGILSVAGLPESAKRLLPEIQYLIAKEIIDNCPKAFYALGPKRNKENFEGHLTLEQVILVKLLYAMARQNRVNTLTDLARRINANHVDLATGQPLLSEKNKVTASELRRILKSFDSSFKYALCNRYRVRDNTWSAYAEPLTSPIAVTYYFAIVFDVLLCRFYLCSYRY